MKQTMLFRTRSLGILLFLALAFSLSATASGLETLVLFDPTVPETPESIVFDRFNNIYVTMAFTGEVRRISPNGVQSTVAFLPIEAPCEDRAFPVSALGLAIDRRDDLYVPISSCDTANQGLWKVHSQDGTIELLANAPDGVVWNGVEVHRGHVYATDTFEGRLWRVPRGGGAAEIWADHPLLKRPPGSVLPGGIPMPGPNGVRFFRGEFYVANTSTGSIIAFPFLNDGTAGEPRVHAVLPDNQVPDEFAFDVKGSIYCATQPFNTVVRLDRDGTAEILLTAADGLDGPSSVAFGRRGIQRRKLFIANAALPIFTTTFRPSLMRLDVAAVGARR